MNTPTGVLTPEEMELRWLHNEFCKYEGESAPPQSLIDQFNAIMRARRERALITPQKEGGK